MVDVTFHYPPELMNLLIETIPLLNRSKDDVILFFKGAGVPQKWLLDLEKQVATNRNSIYKHEIVREVLKRLNQKGEQAITQRREVLRRVVEFENFSACWANDQLKAKGLVAEIRSVVNVKDSFTRMKIEREKERQKHQVEYQKRLYAEAKRKQDIKELYTELSALFSLTDAYKRGKLLESILNRLFQIFGILIREAFTLRGLEGEGIVEQIDGVVELDGHLYLVEMKWHSEKIGKKEISEHLVRVFNRGDARGIFISATDYSQPSITLCKEALNQKVFILCSLREFILALEQERDIKQMLKDKINAAIIEKNPYIYVI